MQVYLNFGETMDNGPKPLASDFIVNIDGVDKDPISTGWASNTQLTISLTVPGLTPAVVRCRFFAKTSMFHSALGELVTPFDILITAP